MALVAALFATALLMGLGLSILLLGTAETTLASHDRDARALAYASRAAAVVAATDLGALPSWSGVAAPGAAAEVSATPGRFLDATLVPQAPWGGTPLDLRALTARLQTDSDAGASPGGPAWRLFEYGALSRLVPESASRNPYYVVVWVSESNGVVVMRSVAYGPGGARSITEISVTRAPDGAPPDRLRLLTIRPGA